MCWKSFASMMAALALAAPVAAQTAAVTFVEPEGFRDASFSRGPGAERDRAAVLRDLERHLQRLAARHLAPGQTLQVEVLDLDLAGQLEPWRRSVAEIRVLRGVTWPSMTVRYTLRDSAGVLASGEEQIADLNYQMRRANYADDDRLRYEKAMLDDWFARRFARRG